MRMDAEPILAKTPLFSEVLDDVQRSALALKCRFVDFPDGAVLMSEGDFGASMYALVEGEVAVHVTERNREEHVATLGAGEIVGEISLLTGARRTASVSASGPVKALEISKVALEPVLVQKPELLDRFCAILERRQKELEEIHAHAGRWHFLGHTGERLIAQVRRFFLGDRSV